MGLKQMLNNMYGIKSIEEVSNMKTEKKEMATKNNNEEWVWVEGFKGTDVDMKCRGYQYEMNKQHDMPEGAKIKDCESGFHLCLTMKHVDAYHTVGNGNRYFKVKALVRKSDRDEYDLNRISNPWGPGSFAFEYDPNGGYRYINGPTRDKLAAKSIIFTEELTRDEILDGIGVDTSEWTDEQKDRALLEGVKSIEKEIIEEKNRKRAESEIEQLTELGYSRPFAEYVVRTLGRYDAAFAAGSQQDLSMDMKVLMILYKGELR